MMRAHRLLLRDQLLATIVRAPGLSSVQLAGRLGRPQKSVYSELRRMRLQGVIEARVQDDRGVGWYERSQ